MRRAVATARNASPSRSDMMPNLASHSRIAFSSMASNTGSSSPGELEMTCSTSDVAVCCSSASVSSRVRACTSSNSRTFSIAITAWSAKVVTSSICLSVKGHTEVRPRPKTPIGVPSRSSGTPSHGAIAAELLCLAQLVLRIGMNIEHLYDGLPSSKARPITLPRPGLNGVRSNSSLTFVEKPKLACERKKPCPLGRRYAPCPPRTAGPPTSTSVSSTACRSKVERLITLSTSAVAVCCCRDSRSSLSSRVFSMAMTAWFAKFWTSSICLSVNGRTSWR